MFRFTVVGALNLLVFFLSQQRCRAFVHHHHNNHHEMFSVFRSTLRRRPFALSATTSNQELVARRLQISREKKEARQRSQQERHQHNLQLKKRFEDQQHGAEHLFAVKVSVCDELRDQIKLNGREKRGRVFVDAEGEGSRTLKGLKFELHSFFRALRKSTFKLEASLPTGEWKLLFHMLLDEIIFTGANWARFN